MGTLEIRSWQAVRAGAPMQPATRTVDTGALADQDVVVRVAGCGVCHTDVGFLFDGVRTGKGFPLTLGHEIAGTVEAAGIQYASLVGSPVVVPAVIPCGTCALCRAGRGSICRAQLFPGSDLDGGFASHIVIPGRGLCVVDPAALARSGVELAELAVLADAVSTPYQAILRSGLRPGDLAIFVGAGGVGGFGAQIAAARGAHVVALDVADDRLAAIRDVCALTINTRDREVGEVRKSIAAHAKAQGWPAFEWKIFETSGHPAGQGLAFGLLTFGAHLSVVGYTLEKISVRLANLMAFDATAQGNWGCLPEHYPGALALILDGKVRLGPFIERRPLSRIDDTFAELHRGVLRRRPVLVPDFT